MTALKRRGYDHYKQTGHLGQSRYTMTKGFSGTIGLGLRKRNEQNFAKRVPSEFCKCLLFFAKSSKDKCLRNGSEFHPGFDISITHAPFIFLRGIPFENTTVISILQILECRFSARNRNVLPTNGWRGKRAKGGQIKGKKTKDVLQ